MLFRSLVEESYEWVDKVVAFEPAVRQWQSAVRDGLKEVGVLPYNGFSLEHLIGTKVGGSIFDDNGNRHTAADLLAYANPNSISVYLHATVQKILFRPSSGNNFLILNVISLEHISYFDCTISVLNIGHI